MDVLSDIGVMESMGSNIKSNDDDNVDNVDNVDNDDNVDNVDNVDNTDDDNMVDNKRDEQN